MDFDYTDTQRLLVESADRLMKDRGTIDQWRARVGLEDGLDRAGWTQFAELGWIALPVPEDAGGLGGSAEDIVLLMIALGKGLATEPIVSTAVLSAHIIDKGVSGVRRKDLLSSIARGDLLISLAHDEPGDRYDLSAPRGTLACRTRDGFLISGTKMLALDAPSANALLVSASIEGEDGTAIFLVDRYADGVSLLPYPLIDGTRAADIDLVSVGVPREQLIALGRTGAKILTEAVDRASVALMGQAVGSMEASVALCRDYAQQRSQFGQPIGSFQAVKHMAVDMFVAAYQARSALYQALAHMEGDAEQRSNATSLAKITVGAASQTVARAGIQIHGGYGVTDEYAISHHYRRLLVLEKHFGDIEHHTTRIARAIRNDAASTA